MGRLLGLALLMAAILALCPAPGHAVDADTPFEYDEIGIVTSNALKALPGPGHGRPLWGLKSGDRVKILRHEGRWLRVLHKGRTGYIQADPAHLCVIYKKKDRDAPDASEKTGRFGNQGEKIARAIRKSMAEVDDFVLQETDIIEYLNDADQTAAMLKEKAARIRSDLRRIRDDIRQSKTSLAALKGKVRAGEKHAEARLVALYKLNCLGSLQILVSAGSLNEIFHQKRALQTLLKRDETLLENFAADKKRLSEILKNLKRQKNRKTALESDLRQDLGEMLRAKKRKEILLKKIRMEKAYSLAAIRSLNRAASELNIAIQSFGFHESRVPGREIGNLNFTAHKGRLEMPVRGRIISRFGPYKSPQFNINHFRSGIEIKSRMGEPIHAVFGGSVLYSRWFKGYGNIIIIDHGDNYYTLYAHLEKLHKKKGDRVKTGEVIATVGDSGSIIGAGLYFEVRHHGKPVDPMKWFKRG